jgi:hypothetical protein
MGSPTPPKRNRLLVKMEDGPVAIDLANLVLALSVCRNT